MQDKKYIVYLHSCGCSQKELNDIFGLGQEKAKIFFESLSHKNLEIYIPNFERRQKILENYEKLKTKHIDTVLEKLSVGFIIL